MYQKLKFRRQFLLTVDPISTLTDWNCLRIGQYFLYAHPDLEVTRIEESPKSIVLIGELYDPDESEKGNADILADILHSTQSTEGFVLGLKRYAGCYALLYQSSGEVVILHDARALREIYYCTKTNKVLCGSQPNLVAKFSSPEAQPSSDPTLLDFYRNHMVDSRWVGDETYFEGIKYLLPDHYFNVVKREVHRYWPNEVIKRLSLDDAVSKSSSFLQGIMRAIVHRHPTMMAVTSGTDSRTLLAASKGIENKIYYFVNNNGLGHNRPDTSVPKKLFRAIRVPFHVHEVPADVDKEFRKIFFNNTFLASDLYLPPIYHVFFKNHSEKTCILGVGEIGRTDYGRTRKKLNSYRMAYQLGYRRSTYAIYQCEKILPEMLHIARKYSINVMDLLHWEQRLGPWGAVRNSESNIAIEKVDPYNSHLLNEIFLGVDEKYKNPLENPCVLFREMIHRMWPELLAWPINPPYTMRDTVRLFLVRIGVFEPLKELKYKVSYLGHLYNNWKFMM